jgi:RNA polymerase sigma-70 factor (ECF subfamily)
VIRAAVFDLDGTLSVYHRGVEKTEQGVKEALASGDVEEAATRTLRGYGPQILGYVRSIIRDPEDAAEVFSQFAEDLWRGLPGFRGECAVRVWAYKIAWHAASRFLRDPYRRRMERLATSMASRLAETLLSSGAALDRRSAEVERLRQHLSADEQTLLVLRVDKRLSWREVADVMGEEGAAVDEVTLRKRYQRLREKLAELARAEGLIGR